MQTLRTKFKTFRIWCKHLKLSIKGSISDKKHYKLSLKCSKSGANTVNQVLTVLNLGQTLQTKFKMTELPYNANENSYVPNLIQTL